MNDLETKGVFEEVGGVMVLVDQSNDGVFSDEVCGTLDDLVIVIRDGWNLLEIQSGLVYNIKTKSSQ